MVGAGWALLDCRGFVFAGWMSGGPSWTAVSCLRSSSLAQLWLNVLDRYMPFVVAVPVRLPASRAGGGYMYPVYILLYLAALLSRPPCLDAVRGAAAALWSTSLHCLLLVCSSSPSSLRLLRLDRVIFCPTHWPCRFLLAIYTPWEESYKNSLDFSDLLSPPFPPKNDGDLVRV